MPTCRSTCASSGGCCGSCSSGSEPPATAARCPPLVGRFAGLPPGLDAVLAKATAAEGGYASIAEVVLGWRAAVVDHDTSTTTLSSDERLAVDSARRQAAQRLARSEAAGINPYRGLRPFDEADAARFFGRGAVVAELSKLLGDHRMVTVVGASGSGKSSVVRAGLVPQLRDGGFDGHRLRARRRPDRRRSAVR